MADIVDNKVLSMSAKGMASLQHFEGAKNYYYDDPAKNCTYGIGTLIHRGPCTPEELVRPVTAEQVAAGLGRGLMNAQKAVKDKVTNKQLTQAQYDALVSYVYNRGRDASRPVLEMIDKGKLDAATREMSRSIYGHVPDKKTGKKVVKVLPGLVQRRMSEAQPFTADKK